MPIVEFFGGPSDGRRSLVALCDPSGPVERREAIAHTVATDAGPARYLRTRAHTPDGFRIYAYEPVFGLFPRSQTFGWEAPHGILVGSWWVEESSEFLIDMVAGDSGASFRVPVALVQERDQLRKQLDHAAGVVLRKAERPESG